MLMQKLKIVMKHDASHYLSAKKSHEFKKANIRYRYVRNIDIKYIKILINFSCLIFIFIERISI